MDQHAYAYCEHDPVNYLDPTGHEYGTGPGLGNPQYSWDNKLPFINRLIHGIPFKLIGGLVGIGIGIVFPPIGPIWGGIIGGGLGGGLDNAWDPIPEKRTIGHVGVGVGTGMVGSGVFGKIMRLGPQ